MAALDPFRDRIVNPPRIGGGAGAFVVATRSDNGAPAIFTNVAARDTYLATVDGTADAAAINVTDADDAQFVWGIGTLDGSNNVTSLTAAYIRLNGAFVAVATNLVGQQGPMGAPGNDGAPGTPGTVDLSGVGADQMPVVNAAGTALEPSGIQQLSDGSLLFPQDIGVESSSIRFGDLATLSETNGFLGINNAQFPDPRFDLIDARRRGSGPSDRPRQFFLTEAENDFTLQPLTTDTITTNPATFTYTATLDAQTNAVRFQTGAVMSNVRVRVRYATGNQTVIKYLPSKAAWVGGTGGYDFTLGMNTVTFPDTPFRTFVNDQIEITLQADSVSLLGITSPSEFPWSQSVIQRGEFRDLAFVTDTRTLEELQDAVAAMFTGGTHQGVTYTYDDVNDVINTTVTGTQPPVSPDPAVSAFSIDIPATVQTNTDLNVSHEIRFTTQATSQITALNLVVTVGDDVVLTVPASDGTHTQNVTLSGIDTSAPGTVSFQIRGTTSGGQAIMSNTQTVAVRVIQADEQAYWGVRPTNDFDTVALSELTSVDVQPPGSEYTIDTSWPQNQVLGILEPADRPISSILNTTLNLETYPDRWTIVDNARTINGQTYRLLTNTNLGASGNVNLRVTHG